MSEDSDSDTWCEGPGPESDVIRHWKKAKNPPKSWQEENKKLMEENSE